MDAPVAVIETPEFLAATRKLMGEEERIELVDYLAINPTAGDLIPGTGGVRKLRWALEGRGKRGGARVIYYFHSLRLPLLLLDAYAKNEKSDLSSAEKNELRQMAKLMAERYGKP
ncbi:MAG: type II toxin-antitoxin system RelE/ParE family toxin [Rhizomicrobium sp.]